MTAETKAMKNKHLSWKTSLRAFLFPRLNRKFLLRLLLLVVLTYIGVRCICQPAWTNGSSMLPTYQERQFLLCWKPAYWFSPPQPGDVVIIRLAGPKVMLLKRVLAVAGDRVEFRQGVLLVNGSTPQESWANMTACDWNLEERTVADGCVYVAGDNRSMEMQYHEFGQVALKRIIGKPIRLFRTRCAD
jgi:signal peptidase I